MVDIVDRGLGVYKLDEILDNLDDVFLGKHPDIHVGVESELAVYPVASNIAQVVALVGEEQVLYDLACAGVVGRVGVAQLAVDVQHGLLLGVAGVFLQSVEDDRVVLGHSLVLVYEYRCGAALENVHHVVFRDHRLAVHYHLVALHGNDFTGILVTEVLVPSPQHTCGELASDNLLQARLAHLHLFGQVEDAEYVLVGLITDGTQKSSHRQLLLSVDVCVHHIVDVGGELYPRTLERNDARGIEQRAIGMHTLAEEHTRRTVQLRHDNALGAIYHKCAVGCHVGDGAKENVLYHRAEILMVGVGAIQLQLSLQRNAIRQATLQALVDGVARRVDVIIEELKNEIVASVGDREVL